jgi:peptidoglycan glycosyltransferase
VPALVPTPHGLCFASIAVALGLLSAALGAREPTGQLNPAVVARPEPPAQLDARLAPAAKLPDLQETARRLLIEARPVLGGIVAVEAASGHIVAFQEYRRAGQTGHPLTQAITPAASVFKIVTTAALLERTRVGPSTRVCIDGGEREIERVHLLAPALGLSRTCRPFGEALGFSRNAVFAQLATEHLLRHDLIELAERLGFNRNLPFERAAQMGTLAVPYNDLQFARTAVGFRGSKLSVLGATQLAYIVASGGELRTMTLRTPSSVSSTPLEPLAPERVLLPATAERLRRMLEVTVHSGTSLEAFTAPGGGSYLGAIRAAGKTGTLQPDAHAPTTSWFIGFAPSRAPELIVAVMLDNSVVWRRKANHVARDLMRAYFHGRPGVSHPFEETPALTLPTSERSARAAPAQPEPPRDERSRERAQPLPR